MEVSSPSSLRHKLRTTVCCCFGSGAGERRSGEKLKWRRRGAVAAFGYDPLSYALNFDEGGADDDDAYGDADAAFRYKNFSSRLPPSPSPTPAQRPTAIAIS
ncbi:hypothetical protein GUJ93_ZPchr0006g41952 [Zizania palustris]|uniref:Uncharacterized protein n=1 Tax=Zizania palustris TaxID=103762 RepID=A0A8J5T128_ZIZPA|nr:hypothetical protein GUJ93_ZPchr0006g41952 [Zizania palustris]